MNFAKNEAKRAQGCKCTFAPLNALKTQANTEKNIKDRGGEAMTQRRLTRREVAKIDKIAEALVNLRAYYYEDEDEPNGKDVLLQIKENGSVEGCISCALAALDTILQEYAEDFTPDR